MRHACLTRSNTERPVLSFSPGAGALVPMLPDQPLGLGKMSSGARTRHGQAHHRCCIELLGSSTAYLFRHPNEHCPGRNYENDSLKPGGRLRPPLSLCNGPGLKVIVKGFLRSRL
jgi:hypothetical protein